MFGINKKDKIERRNNDDWLLPRFTGCGAGLNPAMGSNSAYIMTPSGGMILLECGESVFARMKDLSDFNRAEWLVIILSHTHSDHSGSLGTMVLYNHNVLNRPVSIIAGGYRQKVEIRSLLRSFGVPDDNYNLVTNAGMFRRAPYRYMKTIPDMSFSLMMEKTKHVPQLACYSICLMKTHSDKPHPIELAWSGDTNCPEDVLSLLQLDPMPRIYLEVRADESDEHTSLSDIEDCLDILSEDNVRKKWTLRKQITLMHFDSVKTMREAANLGYNIPKLVK